MPTRKPRIAVTMGDPAGVGPEICLRLLADAAGPDCTGPSSAGPNSAGPNSAGPNSASPNGCTPIVFGDAAVLRRVAGLLKLPFTAPIFTLDSWPDVFQRIDAPAVLDLPHVAADELLPGRVDARCGNAAYQYVMASIDAGLAGQVDAVATGPLNKEALHAAGHKFPGHTEIFAQRLKAERSCMMLTSERITCSLVTIHVGYHEVPELLSVRRILDVIELTVEAMRRIRGREPRLAVCGLNPHAGEHGLFGRREEERIILPAIELAREQGLTIEGPLPPDTAFLPNRREVTDAYVCMYHDQGLIPLKALAFDTAINITLGLPVVRTSVDHGTAFDIAWQGKASAVSLRESVRLASRLCTVSDG